MAQVTGILRLKINGKLQRLKTGTLQIGGKNRTPQVGHALYGYSEEIQPAVITATLAHTADVNEDDLRDLVSGVCLVETDTGKTYMVDGAFTTSPPELSSGEGDFAMEITGNPGVVL